LPLILHITSGHNNFGIVKHDNKNESTSSQQQISADQAKIIQQQTREAIKTAAETDNTNNNKTSK